MRVLVVAPGHAFSTLDVYEGLVWGLRANGAQVVAFPLHQSLDMAGVLVGAAAQAGAFSPDDDPDALMFSIAANGIPGMAMYHQVDAAIVVTGQNLPYSIPLTLRKGGILTALLCTESPYLTRQRERHDAACYDVVFTNERTAVGLFDRNEPGRVHYLPHAYHPARHRPEGPAAPRCDVAFVGTAFPERRALFDAVDWDGVDFQERSVVVKPDARGAEIAAVLRATTPNAETAAIYRGARIVLNHHRTTGDYKAGEHIDDPAESIGPRAYEAAACGAFQVSDWRPELDDVFHGSVPTYDPSRPETLGALVRHYLAHPMAREALAREQRAAVAEHHWGNRARAVLDILTSTPRGLSRAHAAAALPPTPSTLEAA